MLTATNLDPETRRATDLFIERASARYDIAEIILFGSRARGDHHPDSDADLAVVLRGPPRPFNQVLFEMADLAFDTLLESGVLIQALPLWEGEWAAPDHYFNPRLLHTIVREGARL